MAGTIGIKVANGNFYPILGEGIPARKKIVLTTVHDNQDSVQIDLYRSSSATMLDAQYIGSLVVEDLMPRGKGDPSIEMVISAVEDGKITAEAYDLDAPPDSDHHVLDVSLRTIDALAEPEDFPDFETLEGDEAAPQAGREGGKKRKSRKGLLLLLLLLLLLGAAAVWFFLFGGRELLSSAAPWLLPGQTQTQAQAAPPALDAPPAVEPAPLAAQPAQAAAAQPAQTAAQPPPAEVAEVVLPVAPPSLSPETVALPASPAPPPVIMSPPVIQAPVVAPIPPPAPAEDARPPSPVLAYAVPAVIPPGGVAYEIRWGDTLWDISAAFYRNPFLYPHIARYNNITNPNRILAGFTVRVPPLP